MWWTKDGIVMGSEGNGCCPLNCSHVYGYTTLMERLFPDLAKDSAPRCPSALPLLKSGAEQRTVYRH